MRISESVELQRRLKEFEAKRDAQRQADEEAAQAPHTVAGVLMAEITKAASSGAHIPLNGPQVIRAALSGLGVSRSTEGSE